MSPLPTVKSLPSNVKLDSTSAVDEFPYVTKPFAVDPLKEIPPPPPLLAIQFVPVPVEDNIWPEDPASPDESLIVPATVIFPWKYASSVVVPFLSVIASTSNA